MPARPLTFHGSLHHGSLEAYGHTLLEGGVWNLACMVEEENEEEMAEGRGHNTAVAAHQMKEETTEGAADRVVPDMAAAAGVPPPANAIKQYYITGG